MCESNHRDLMRLLSRANRKLRTAIVLAPHECMTLMLLAFSLFPRSSHTNCPHAQQSARDNHNHVTITSPSRYHHHVISIASHPHIAIT